MIIRSIGQQPNTPTNCAAEKDGAGSEFHWIVIKISIIFYNICLKCSILNFAKQLNKRFQQRESSQNLGREKEEEKER